MVFPSVPVYLDPPNWNQQAQQSGIGNHGSGASQAAATQLPLGAVAQPPPRAPEGSMSSSTSARPSSMAERARLAKIPQPEPALNCPRCDSTNTKFCYYNNYSLSQPRHFCKTCRRYWTRGGSMRNVPVGGGCRRNKRTKSASKSKSSSTTNNASTTTMSPAGATSMSVPQHLPFMGPMHGGNLADHVGATDLGLSFSGIPPIGVEFPVSSGNTIGVGLEQWRVQQFPFLGGMELPPRPPTVPAMYHLDLEGSGNDGGGNAFGIGQNTVKAAQLALEENQQRLGLSRQYFDIQQSHSIWGGANASATSGGGGGWPADLAGFNNSSSGNIL